MKPSRSRTKVGCIVFLSGLETKKGVTGGIGSTGVANPLEGVTGLDRVRVLVGRFVGLVHPLPQPPTPNPIPTADAESLRTIRPLTLPPSVGARFRIFWAVSSAAVDDDEDGGTSSSEMNESTSLRRKISSRRAFSFASWASELAAWKGRGPVGGVGVEGSRGVTG